MSDYIIKADDLTKKYQKKVALNELTVIVPDNGIIGLVGRNGSGKTTFLKLCAGLLEKTGGTIEVFGYNPMDNLRVLSNLVYTYHDLQYEKSLKLQNIFQNYSVMFPSFDMGFAGKLLKYFELLPGMKYAQLSQGMASIFNFICGLSCRAPLTMFDEPVLGMDVTVRKAAYEVLLREYAENPRTIIISSHLLSEIEGVLSDIILIDAGKLILHKSIDELRQSAYMLDGDLIVLERFCQGKNVIWRKSGETGNIAVIYEKINDTALQAAVAAGLRLSAVRTEDLCVYLTRENKEGELECLWTKAN